MVTKCIFTNLTIPNPHKGKVVGYKNNKKCFTNSYLGIILHYAILFSKELKNKSKPNKQLRMSILQQGSFMSSLFLSYRVATLYYNYLPC
jgi:hypothetical protein